MGGGLLGGGPGEHVFGGCTNPVLANMRKTCAMHGGKGYCTEPDCWLRALKWGGNCK